MRPAPTAMGFIDLHCHLLPGVDDGGLDRDDSVAMARVAVKEGVEAICATPHIRHDHDVRIGEIAGRVAALDEELERREIPLYWRADLPRGASLSGPAVIAEDETSTYVPARFDARIAATGSIVLERRAS